MNDSQAESSSLLVQFLADCDARCPSCGYHLRGSESDRCPECGRAFRLGLIRPAAFDGWWAASVFGASLAALLSVVLLGIAVISDDGMSKTVTHPHYFRDVATQGFRRPAWSAFATLICYAAGSGALASFLAASRRRWRDWPVRRRRLISVNAIASPLLVPSLMYILYYFA